MRGFFKNAAQKMYSALGYDQATHTAGDSVQEARETRTVEKAAPHLPIATFGASIGQCTSCVAVAQGGGFECVMSELGRRDIKSGVAFRQKERLVGEKAVALMPRHWKTTVLGYTGCIGLNPSGTKYDIEKYWAACPLSVNNKGECVYKLDYYGADEEPVTIYPQHAYGMQLNYLKSVVTNAVKSDVKNAVLAVPAHFNSAQRQLVLNSCVIAGISASLINESSAAALEYGLFRYSRMAGHDTKDLICAICDIGYSCSTVSIISFSVQACKVLGTVCDDSLGGRNFDDALFKHFAREINRMHPSISITADQRSVWKVRNSCEQLKKTLSANGKASFDCELGEVDISIGNLERDWFEKLAEPLLQNLAKLVQKAKALPGVIAENAEVSCVEIIGGASRMPCVKRVLQEGFNLPLSTTLNAEETVAKGAAAWGAMTAKETVNLVRRYRLSDRLYKKYDALIKDESGKDQVVVLFTEGEPFPSRKAFNLSLKGQATLIVQCEGETMSSYETLSRTNDTDATLNFSAAVDSSGIVSLNATESSAIGLKSIGCDVTLHSIQALEDVMVLHNNTLELVSEKKNELDKLLLTWSGVADDVASLRIEGPVGLPQLMMCVSSKEAANLHSYISDVQNWLDSCEDSDKPETFIEKIRQFHDAVRPYTSRHTAYTQLYNMLYSHGMNPSGVTAGDKPVSPVTLEQALSHWKARSFACEPAVTPSMLERVIGENDRTAKVQYVEDDGQGSEKKQKRKKKNTK